MVLDTPPIPESESASAADKILHPLPSVSGELTTGGVLIARPIATRLPSCNFANANGNNHSKNPATPNPPPATTLQTPNGKHINSPLHNKRCHATKDPHLLPALPTRVTAPSTPLPPSQTFCPTTPLAATLPPPHSSDAPPTRPRNHRLAQTPICCSASQQKTAAPVHATANFIT